jgi:hypothetical protein
MKTTMIRRRMTGTALLLASATFALSGCGGADAAGDKADAGSNATSDKTASAAAESVTYDFSQAAMKDDQQTPVIAQDQPLILKPSAEMQAAIDKKDPATSVGKNAWQTGIASYEVKAKSFATGVCRMDIAIHYYDGVDPSSIEDSFTTQYSPAGIHSTEDRGTGQGDQKRPDNIVKTDTLPSDDDLENFTTYITKDLTQATVVADCNKDLAVVQLQPAHLEVDLSMYQETYGDNQIATMVSTKNAGTSLEQSASGAWS